MDRIYSLHGLRIRSDIPLPCPELRGTEDSADVELREAGKEEFIAALGSRQVRAESDEFWTYHQFEDGAVHVSWKDHFDFCVAAGGGRVLWRRAAAVADEVLFTYLLNQVLAYCLVARGSEPLHATAVVVDGCAVAFLGESGRGKSTLAAAFVSTGRSLLTDDVLVPQFVGTEVFAHPSLPRLKLLPEAANAVFGGRRSQPMNAFTNKMILPLGADEFVAHPVPLRAIVSLAPEPNSGTFSMRRATGQHALLPLIANTFEPTFFDRKRLAQQFQSAHRLASIVPVYTLHYKRRLGLLPTIAASLLARLTRDGILPEQNRRAV